MQQPVLPGTVYLSAQILYTGTLSPQVSRHATPPSLPVQWDLCLRNPVRSPKNFEYERGVDTDLTFIDVKL